VIVATPHYQHTTVTIEALRRNIYVLVEKPVATHVKDAERMISVYVSSIRESKVRLPLDGNEYDLELQKLIQNSTYRKLETDKTQVTVDVNDSFR